MLRTPPRLAHLESTRTWLVPPDLRAQHLDPYGSALDRRANGMPKSKTKAKWYAVRYGRQPGVYETWPEAEAQVTGFPGAVHRSYATRAEAEAFAGTSNLEGASRAGIHALLRKPRRPLPAQGRIPSPRPPGSQRKALDPSQETEKGPTLSPEQAAILARIVNGENIFFSGSAGTGKSVLLRAIISAFRERAAKAEEEVEKRHAEEVGEYVRSGIAPATWRRDGEEGGRKGGRKGGRSWRLGVTASTGMAAVNIGGCTLHSWAGVGLGKEAVKELQGRILRNNVTRQRWIDADALIIDEVSMIDGILFDKLETLARLIRKNDAPFGGIQVILTGDFYQLPPVSEREGPGTKFAFDADSWERVIGEDNMYSLTRVFRQREDGFVRILERMRKGELEPGDEEALKACERVKVYDDGIEPVGLYASKAEVAKINAERLAALDTPLQEYAAHDAPGFNSRGIALSKEQATDLLNRNTLWQAVLQLKVGAMVMLITNMQDGNLVNGSTGRIVEFLTIPEALAQSAYFPARAQYANPRVEERWPIVEFPPPRSAPSTATRKVILPSMSVDVNNAQSEPEATRTQVPLILAWALTIHKAQGQSIERLKVDLGRVFETGQTYVALSRATSLETLEVQNFRKDRVKAHPRVIEWSRRFEEEQANDAEWDELLKDHVVDI